MKVSEYIRDLLLFHEKLTLPGFGTFEITRKPAVLTDQEITPPSSAIIFYPYGPVPDDDTLIHKIADAEEIEYDEAKKQVIEYISEIQNTLNRGDTYYIEGLGKLFADENKNYLFEKDENLILTFEAGSFEPFELEPLEISMEQDNNVPADNIIEKEPRDIINPEFIETAPDETFEPASQGQPEYDLVEEKKSNINFIRILSGSVVVILISLVILALTTDLTKNLNLITGRKDKPAGDPLYILGEPEDYDKNMEAAIDSITRLENALKISDATNEEPVTSTAYSEYHIIAGSFSLQKNADELQKELSIKGFPSLIINRGDGFYRVSVTSFSDKEKAVVELEKFRKSTQYKSAWVLGLN